MRCFTIVAAVLLPASFAWAHGMNDRPLDSRALADLEAKAAVASPNEQPYLYAELVHSMTEIATEQYQAGQDQQASASLKVAQKLCRENPDRAAAGREEAEERRDPDPAYGVSAEGADDGGVAERPAHAGGDDAGAESGADGDAAAGISPLSRGRDFSPLRCGDEMRFRDALEALQKRAFSFRDPHAFNSGERARRQYSSGDNRTRCKGGESHPISSLDVLYGQGGEVFVL